MKKPKLPIETEKTLDEIVEKENATDNLMMNEGILSWSGKLFFAGIATYLAGVAMEKLAGKSATPPRLPFKIKGTPQQINSIVDAIFSSTAFQRELSRPGASVESVINKLNIKNMSKAAFERLTHRPWPLG